MSKEHVQVTGSCTADPEAVWAVARDFCGTWHPTIATMREQRDARGSLVRAFTVQGEDTVYREQLTYFSDADRTFSYTLLEGIEAATAYSASLSIAPDSHGGSEITMQAVLEAESLRAREIAEGTEVVFAAGVKALAAVVENSGELSPVPVDASGHDLSPASPIEERIVGSAPVIGISVTPEKTGPLCLFLHGIGGRRTNWKAQLEVAGHSMLCAAMDLRGYGDSTLGSEQSSVDEYCADILRVKKELRAEKLVLCGLSYGAWIATSFAMRHPEILAGLVLSGGCTGMSEATFEERESFRASRAVPLGAGKTPADFAPEVIKVIAGPHARKEVRVTLLESMQAISAATYRDALNCFTSPAERFNFATLSMPVLMMTGEFDRLASPAEIRGVANRIVSSAPLADVRFEVIQGAGHVCNIENPQQFNAHLVEFLAKVSS